MIKKAQEDELAIQKIDELRSMVSLAELTKSDLITFSLTIKFFFPKDKTGRAF